MKTKGKRWLGLEVRFGCKIMWFKGRYYAYTGGEGLPVVDLCKADTLQTLAVRLARLGRPLIDIL